MTSAQDAATPATMASIRDRALELSQELNARQATSTFRGFGEQIDSTINGRRQAVQTSALTILNGVPINIGPDGLLHYYDGDADAWTSSDMSHLMEADASVLAGVINATISMQRGAARATSD